MNNDSRHIAVRGKSIRVPAARVDGHTVVVTGGFVKMAIIHDEEFIKGEVVANPRFFISAMSETGLRADMLTFAEKIYQKQPKHAYPFEWDNAAVACTANFSDWWENLPQVSRKNVRRAAKRGVSVRVAVYDDQFVRGIKDIYDEMPVRQGRRFWHFGKDFDTVKTENSSYLERSEFLGAYYNDELIGFMKFVYVDNVAVMMQILSKASHYDKRPMNALIAKAIEVCHEKGADYLVYSKLTFGNKTKSDIAEFKLRNGFVQMDFPRYYVPLTLKGRIALGLKLHRGPLGLLPSGLIRLLWSVRSRWHNLMTRQAWLGAGPAKEPIPQEAATDSPSGRPIRKLS